MLILIVLLTIAAILIGLQRSLYRKQQQVKLAFNQLSHLISSLSEVAGKTIDTMRNNGAADTNLFTRLNQLRWQTTSRKIALEKKVQALNELLLLFTDAQQKVQDSTPQYLINEQLSELQQQWQQLLKQLNHEKEFYNTSAIDFNATLANFPFGGIAKILRYHKKTLLHLPKS